MDGILIQYSYDGDESEWEKAISEFIHHIDQDAELSGKFFYSVFKTSEPNKRAHVGRWESNEVLETLKKKDFFGVFTQTMQKLAGDSLSSSRLQAAFETKA